MEFFLVFTRPSEMFSVSVNLRIFHVRCSTPKEAPPSVTDGLQYFIRTSCLHSHFYLGNVNAVQSTPFHVVSMGLSGYLSYPERIK
jgi:hypothetical protein